MKKNYIYTVAATLIALALVLSCSKSEVEQQNNENGSEEITGPQITTITAYLPEEEPKVAITEATDYGSAILNWEENDQIVLVDADNHHFTYGINNETIDGKQASFTKVTLGNIGLGPYTIFYHRSKPLDLDKFNSVSYDGQVQEANGSTSHLQYGAKIEGLDLELDSSNLTIIFTKEWAEEHSCTLTENSVIQFLLKLPEGVSEVYSIYIHDGGDFKQTLWMKDGENLYAAPNSKQVIKGYMMIPELDLTGQITVRVETEDGAFEASYDLNTTDWVGGSQYTIQKNMSALSAVTGDHAAMEIHAKSAQDILQFKAGVLAGKARFEASTVTLENDITISAWNESISGFQGKFGSTSSADKKCLSVTTGTAALFNDIPSGATLENLILDGSFAFTHTSSTQYSPLANQLHGRLSYVTVSANIELTATSTSSWMDLGGLVGRVNGGAASFSNCEFTGSISVPSTFSTSNVNGLRLGGLVGYLTKAITISNCSFKGTIKCEGTFSAGPIDYSDPEKHPTLIVGGIVGKLQNGTISSCTTIDAEDSSKPYLSISETTYKGSILLKTSACNAVAVGGITGFCYDGSASITGCTNNTSILTNVTPTDAANVYLFSGGIVGLNRNNITDCKNNGAQQHFSSSRIQSIGGIIGRQHAGTITVSSDGFSNTGSITIYSSPTSGSYQLATGGIIGLSTIAINGGDSNLISNSSTGTISQKFNGLKNSATASATNQDGVFIGGIVGFSSVGIAHTSNQGSIEFVCKHVGSETEEGGANFVHLGGIVGKVTPTSLVDIEYCSNSGNITFDPTLTAPHHNGKSGGEAAITYAKYDHNYIGGIVGYGYLVNIKGDSSNKTTNSGTILGGDGSGNNNTAETFWVGGIVGRLEGASSSISYCELTGSGKANNNHFSNKAYNSYCPLCGGIAGEVLGSSANHASVSNCTVSSTADIIGRRGQCGGIIGYSRYGDISNCTVPISFGNSAYCYGGIIGWLRQGSVSSSTFSGSKIRSSQMSYGGGIVGYLQNSTIDGCNSDATDVSKNGATATAGGIAGQTTSGATIMNCHYKSSISMCGDSNYTDGGNNAADR